MTLDSEICWRAWVSRDRRFVGRFVMGVTSTGIYCRPGCPAKLPARHRVRFYGSPAAAESAGFRPCLRCRPDSAPGSAAWRGTSATVTRALRLIEAGALSHGSLEALAARLGVTSRWLRELFMEHVGASPSAVARTRQAHFARRLLGDTTLPLEDVAVAAGFGSARRLRETLRHTFRRTPTALRGRRRTRTDDDAGALVLRLPARLPFDPTPLLAFLAQRAIPGVEEVRVGLYRRTFTPAKRSEEGAGATAPLVLEARADAATGVALRVPPAALAELPWLVARVTRVFDLDADAEAIARQLGRDRRLARALAGRTVRVPGAFDAFEAGVRALLGQQVSVAAARTLAHRLVLACGARAPEAAGGLTHAFPTPAAVAAARLERLGLTGSRAAALRGFARAVADGALDLGLSAGLDDAVARLTALPGIGDWTAHYLALRALGEPDAFPAGDLGVRKALARGGRLPTEHAVRVRAESWRPWRAYAVIALWTEPPRNVQPKRPRRRSVPAGSGRPDRAVAGRRRGRSRIRSLLTPST